MFLFKEKFLLYWTRFQIIYSYYILNAQTLLKFCSTESWFYDSSWFSTWLNFPMSINTLFLDFFKKNAEASIYQKRNHSVSGLCSDFSYDM